MADISEENLIEAIERNLPAVLSLPSAGMFRHYKSRFLSNCSDGIWIDSVPGEQLLIDTLIATAQPAALSFTLGQQKKNFAVPIVRRDDLFRVNPTTVVRALLIYRPILVKAVQRRNHYRAAVRDVDQISVQVWRIGEYDAIENMPPDTAIVKAAVQNISLGGIGVILVNAGNRLTMVAGERVRLILRLPGMDPVLIEGRCNAPPTTIRGQIEAGIQFIGLQARLEGRRILTELTKLIGALQREEVKRIRRMSA